MCFASMLACSHSIHSPHQDAASGPSSPLPLPKSCHWEVDQWFCLQRLDARHHLEDNDQIQLWRGLLGLGFALRKLFSSFCSSSVLATGLVSSSLYGVSCGLDFVKLGSGAGDAPFVEGRGQGLTSVRSEM